MTNQNNNGNPYPAISKEECKGCQRCVLACKENCIGISSEFNDAGYQYAYYLGEGCVGCRDCYYTCPEPIALEIHSFKRKSNPMSVLIKSKVRRQNK
ncbi:MAG: 4Fe-4S dicluster domain-containing protein [Methanobrevibacter sp.]|uniref:4Fe-4S dicluster domain-containing protein n=1 Tax=Methanobrevibacter sp. TaxID=66852 RepID=UPI0026E05AF2|nr:4Fe-4S dicluster domain-containing protein [Methanobrevibacter sp.]MDO5848994.1 4Fe-4S dicluster domain-containing protein [Methanobrevibacter sp.]